MKSSTFEPGLSLLCGVLYSSDLNTVILNLYDRLTKAKNNVPLPCSKEFVQQSRKGTFFSLKNLVSFTNLK